MKIMVKCPRLECFGNNGGKCEVLGRQDNPNECNFYKKREAYEAEMLRDDVRTVKRGDDEW